MKLQDFMEKLDLAGWVSCSDSQHVGISKLHRELFPVVASLEAEVVELQKEIVDAACSG